MPDLADRLFAFEEGQLGDEESIRIFADLVRSGWAWSLQGWYGRHARDLIEARIISEDGEVLATWFYDKEETDLFFSEFLPEDDDDY